MCARFLARRADRTSSRRSPGASSVSPRRRGARAARRWPRASFRRVSRCGAGYGPGDLREAASLTCGHYMPVHRATQLLSSPACSPPSSGRLADVAGNPTRGVQTHGVRARQRSEVILDALQLGGADPLRPLIVELVEDRLALAQHVEAELGHLKALAAGGAGGGGAGGGSAPPPDPGGLRGRTPWGSQAR